MEVARGKDKDDAETGGGDKGFQGLPPATTEVPLPCSGPLWTSHDPLHARGLVEEAGGQDL
eukprot:8703-Lingulodinium_polyedra.AAC.1